MWVVRSRALLLLLLLLPVLQRAGPGRAHRACTSTPARYADNDSVYTLSVTNSRPLSRSCSLPLCLSGVRPSAPPAPACCPCLPAQSMPILGLGTFEATEPGEIKRALTAAVKAGYRLIDCAANYGNQKEVGETLAELFAEGVVKREELFIVSKLFQTHHAWDGDDSRCKEALATTLEDLQLDYLDLYLMHWPFAFGNKKLEMPPGTPQPLRESNHRLAAGSACALPDGCLTRCGA
eukprot:COSAG02_NODE_68_length_42582_cov_52.351129_47_plen_236_part_00